MSKGMSRERINFVLSEIIKFAEKYPQFTANAIVTKAGWNQSSMTRALESREMELPERTGRLAFQDYVWQLFEADDFDGLRQFKADMEVLAASTDEATELPEEFQPKPKAKKAKKSKAKAEDEDSNDTDADEEVEVDEDEEVDWGDDDEDDEENDEE